MGELESKKGIDVCIFNSALTFDQSPPILSRLGKVEVEAKVESEAACPSHLHLNLSLDLSLPIPSRLNLPQSLQPRRFVPYNDHRHDYRCRKGFRKLSGLTESPILAH